MSPRGDTEGPIGRKGHPIGNSAKPTGNSENGQRRDHAARNKEGRSKTEGT